MVKERCIFNLVHVHTAARIIAIKTVIFSVFRFSFLLFQLLYLKKYKNSKDVNPGFVVRSYAWLLGVYEELNAVVAELCVCVALAFAAVLLYYGNRVHKQSFYVPFIIYASLEMIQAFFNIGYYVWRTILLSAGEVGNAFQPDEIQQATNVCIGLISIITAFYILRTYFLLYVVNQARTYVAILANSERLSTTKHGSAVRLDELTLPKPG